MFLEMLVVAEGSELRKSLKNVLLAKAHAVVLKMA